MFRKIATIWRRLRGAHTALFDYFRRVTVTNWGLPYHLFIAYTGTHVLSKFIPLQVAMFSVLAILAIYELYQLFGRRWRDRKLLHNSKEDMLANITGALLAALIISL